jgi:hypothetical protein
MRTIVTIALIAFMFSSCFIFHPRAKYGCPSDGRNVGAEKLASGDAKALRASQKAKFRGNQ